MDSTALLEVQVVLWCAARGPVAGLQNGANDVRGRERYAVPRASLAGRFKYLPLSTSPPCRRRT